MSKKIYLSGIVQGVGCRQYCMRYARKHSLRGAVSNLRNGDVELLIDGDVDSSTFDIFLNDLKINSQNYFFYGKIEKIAVQEYDGPIRGDYRF